MTPPTTHIRRINLRTAYTAWCGLAFPPSSISAAMLGEIRAGQVVAMADCIELCPACVAAVDGGVTSVVTAPAETGGDHE